MIFMILFSAFFGYFIGLTKISRSALRQKYIRRLTRSISGGKKKEDSNTQHETLRQNFFIEEE
tara:strand:- start:9588 stop:9776 length:189 start_codon:yes stop_codon:yes gene_type:complete